MSSGVQFVGVQTAARERAIANLNPSAMHVGLLALEVSIDYSHEIKKPIKKTVRWYS
jgi:hypothetical protein